jgi:6-phosphogluconolactonase
MKSLSRRTFLITASAATVTVASPSIAQSRRQRVFVGSLAPDNGILAYDWDPVKAELTPAGVAAKVSGIEWITLSPNREYLFAASAVSSFQGKPTGGVISYRINNGALQQLSAQNSAGEDTCHVGVDPTGHVAISADYAGASAASFLINEGRLSPMVWSEHFTVHGPNPVRQPTAHGHFASFSPDNRFAYMNDLGGDMIHIYHLNTATAMLTPAGAYHTQAGAGPRTLHFHPNGHTAYCINELNSTVDVLEWHKSDGQLTLVTRLELLPADYHGRTQGCDTLISKDGRSVYFANRANDFLFTCKADPKTGALTPVGRSNCGGKTPRNFVLDPTERWMLVADQDSNFITVLARNPETGVLAEQGNSFAAASPMCILFA